MPKVTMKIREDLFIFDEDGTRIDLGPCMCAEVEVDGICYRYNVIMPLAHPELENAYRRLATEAVKRRAGLA